MKYRKRTLKIGQTGLTLSQDNRAPLGGRRQSFFSGRRPLLGSLDIISQMDWACVWLSGNIRIHTPPKRFDGSSPNLL